jgi:hypothetical protein
MMVMMTTKTRVAMGAAINTQAGGDFIMSSVLGELELSEEGVDIFANEGIIT